MKKNKTYLTILLLLVFATTSVAQIIDANEAYEHFKFGNFMANS